VCAQYLELLPGQGFRQQIRNLVLGSDLAQDDVSVRLSLPQSVV
jgi:hypothetical protein